MKHSKRTYLEDELSSYPKIERYILELREEILYPYKEQEDNIGGSQQFQTASPTEIKATRLVIDKRLKRLQELKQAIETVYQESNDIGKRLMDEYYFKNRTHTIRGLALKFSYNKTDLYRIQKDILRRLSEELGI